MAARSAAGAAQLEGVVLHPSMADSSHESPDPHC